MNIKDLSQTYTARLLEEKDIPMLYDLCKANPLYYEYHPPMITYEEIKEDMVALPQGKTKEDKYYFGLFEGERCLAIIDLILKYPNDETAFVGFFMVNHDVQGKGVGTLMVTQLCEGLKQMGYQFVRLGYIKGNPQSQAFWEKNAFKPTGLEKETEDYTIVVMQRTL